MCVYSMCMDNALKWPPYYWNIPPMVDNLEKLLKDAKTYDEKTNQPDCELEEKKAALKKIADSMGININFE